jgi:hypothetical protein
MEGRRADALRTADEVRDKMHADMMRDPAMGGMVQHMRLTPLFTRVRFSMWDEVLAELAPPDDLPYMTAMWHAARGLAQARVGRLADARQELAIVSSFNDDESLKAMPISSANMASSIVAIAGEVLAAEIAAASKRTRDASQHFAKAVALEDALIYMEPPDWPVPVRQLQGAAMLDLGQFAAAEAAFRGDLRKFPDNGWSLSGLQTSLQRQGKRKEADAIAARLTEQWQKADVELDAARMKSPAR